MLGVTGISQPTLALQLINTGIWTAVIKRMSSTLNIAHTNIYTTRKQAGLVTEDSKGSSGMFVCSNDLLVVTAGC